MLQKIVLYFESRDYFLVFIHYSQPHTKRKKSSSVGTALDCRAEGQGIDFRTGPVLMVLNKGTAVDLQMAKPFHGLDDHARVLLC